VTTALPKVASGDDYPFEGRRKEKFMSQEITLDEVYSDEQVETEVVTEEVAEPETEETVEAEPEVVETTATDTAEKPKTDWTFSQARDEREKRQKFEKENAELKQQLAEKDQTESVSVFSDEEGYTAQQDEKVNTKVSEAVLSMSRAYAVREFGEEKVAAAEGWYAQEGMKSPHAIDRINKSSLKFHEAVGLFDEEQARIDPESYKAKMKAEILAELDQTSSPEAKREAIKPSLATSRSAGTEKVPKEEWDDILGE